MWEIRVLKSSNWHKNHLPSISHLIVIKHIAFIAQHYFKFPPQVFLIVSTFKTKEKELNKGANIVPANECSVREREREREKLALKYHSFQFKLDLNKFKD